MSKKSSTKFYQINKENLQKKEQKKKKMLMKDIKIFLKR